MWLINVSFLQLMGRGRFCHPGHYILCLYDMKRGTRPLCSLQQESRKTFFPPFPSVLLHFHLPDGGCALTFAGINLLVYLDFPSLICLNEINGHSCGQIYPKLSKGTWSINKKLRYCFAGIFMSYSCAADHLKVFMVSKTFSSGSYCWKKMLGLVLHKGCHDNRSHDQFSFIYGSVTFKETKIM